MRKSSSNTMLLTKPIKPKIVASTLMREMKRFATLKETKMGLLIRAMRTGTFSHKCLETRREWKS